ncbi:MAG: hypothetical protein SV375_23325, partial [Thermodesulfobacteriota bacterium]|nr:hypothetical protein [Thermodesulfobacteriota bacterium]
GKTITNSFFREYTQKFLKLDLKHCHMDWAETGINRATIDSDIRSSSIVDLLFGLLSNKKVNTRFLYPKDGAIDIFSTLLAERIRQTGGQIEVGVRIDKALIRDRKVRSLMDADGRQYDLDFLFWSGSALDLERMLCCEKSGLNYCCTLLCNMLIEGRPAVPVQWEYFGSRELIFSRVSINTSFNPCLALEGYYGVCVEIVCYENDYIWANGEKLLNIIIHNLIKTNIVSNFNSVVDVHFEKVKNTYPIYKLDYLEELKTYQKKIAQFKNVLAFGRTGGFWYNNMDHSIRSSIDLAKTVSREDLEDKINSPAGVFRGDF